MWYSTLGQGLYSEHDDEIKSCRCPAACVVVNWAAVPWIVGKKSGMPKFPALICPSPKKYSVLTQ